MDQDQLCRMGKLRHRPQDLPCWKGKLKHRAQAHLTLMEAPANRASCLMCCPFFPMMAPTACVGMNKFTTSCSGSCEGMGTARLVRGLVGSRGR